MKIEHIAIWTKDLERSRQFYCEYFNGISNEKYHNTTRNFESYFISFESGARLEIMRLPDLVTVEQSQLMVGLAHIAFEVGSNDDVDSMTEMFRSKGIPILGLPRTTGDGYYESVIQDPDGNIIELCAQV